MGGALRQFRLNVVVNVLEVDDGPLPIQKRQHHSPRTLIGTS